MRNLLVSGVAALALGVGPVAAADMPVRAPLEQMPPAVAPLFDWSGFYIGASAGYGWGSTRHSEPAGGANASFNANGWLAGGTIGANWQTGHAVFGIEGDLSWANMDGSAASAAGVLSSELSWIGTGRVRAGYAVDSHLFYVTGGAAWGRVQASGGGGSGSSTHFGWTVGAGIETMLTTNWTAKVEYLYADLGSKSTYTAAGPVNVALTSHIVRMGLNYRF